MTVRASLPHDREKELGGPEVQVPRPWCGTELAPRPTRGASHTRPRPGFRLPTSVGPLQALQCVHAQRVSLMLGVKLGTFLLTSQLCLAAHSLPRPSPPQRASQGRERSAWRPPVPAVTDGAAPRPAPTVTSCDAGGAAARVSQSHVIPPTQGPWRGQTPKTKETGGARGWAEGRGP